MELRGVDAAELDRGGKAHPVLAPGLLQRPAAARRAVARARLGIIGVHEVEARGIGHAVEEAQTAAVLDAVPAHVWHLAASRKAADDARNHVETAALAELLAAGEEQLVAEADAEKRSRAVERAPQRAEQVEAREVRHRVVKRAVAGQHHGIRVVDRARILGDERRHTDACERLFDRPEIAPAVVYDRNHRLASPTAAARTATIAITGSPRLRLRRVLPRSQSQARLAYGCGAHCHDRNHRLASPTAAARTATIAITGSPRLRLRRALPRSQSQARL